MLITIHTSVLTIGTYLDGKDQSSLQLSSSALHPQMDCLTPHTSCEQTISL